MSGTRTYQGPPPTYTSGTSTTPNRSDLESTPLIPGGFNKRRSYRYHISKWALITIAFMVMQITMSFLFSNIYIKYGALHQRQEWERERREEQWRREEERKEEQWRREEEKREEQWHREEETRQRLGMYWDRPLKDWQCMGYNTRHYWARLMNTVPYDYNWLKPCEEMPLILNGRSVTTSRCDVQDSGVVYGHWYAEGEPLCTPYWDQFNDKGCTIEGSGHRRYQAHLENVHGGEDAELLCATAPIDFKGMHFDRPTSCANLGNDGVFGIWEVEDSSC